MRRLPAVLAAAGLVAVALAGCSASASTAAGCPRPTPATGAALDLVQVTGEPDAVPEVDIRGPLHTDQTQWADIRTGDGTTITTPDQLVVLDVSLFGGETGERTVSVGYEGDLSQPVAMAQWETIFPTLGTALQCATEGSRVVVALPPDALEREAANTGVAASESSVLVVDVRKAYLPAADGALQYNDAQGLPTVVRAADGQPGIIVPDGAAPSEPVVQVLKKGAGAALAAEDTVRVQLTAVDWDTREVTTTTWGSTPQPIDLSSSSVPAGLRDALVGQTVGSQLLIVSPAVAQGSATVAVIDVLGVDGATP